MSYPNGRTPAPVQSDGSLSFEENEPVFYYPQITMSATVQHRGRAITVIAADMNAEQFCDLLDKRFGLPNPTTAPAAMPSATPTGEAPMCPIHSRRMKVSNYGGWFCTFSDPTTGEKCKQKVK